MGEVDQDAEAVALLDDLFAGGGKAGVGSCQQAVNVGSELHDGVNLTLRTTVVSRLTIDANYSFLHREISGAPGVFPTGTPTHKAVATATARLPYGATATLSTRHQSGSVAMSDNGLPLPAASFTLVDTNGDPDDADYVIPGNDDAIRSCLLIVHALAEAISNGKQKVSAQELQQQREAAEEAPTATELAPEDDVEYVQAGEDIEPVTEGDSVPVPTGEDPAKEGAEETKRSAAALGDPTKAGSVVGEADDARREKTRADLEARYLELVNNHTVQGGPS